MSTQKDCPIGCGRTARDGQLMCPRCWSAVPKEIQTRVYATWRAWRKNIRDVDNMRAYTSARDDAIASVA